MTMTRPILSFLLLTATCVSMSSADKVLRQLHIITRQGSSSTVLNNNGLEDEPIQILSSVGQKQLEKLGSWVRNEYSDTSQETYGIPSHYLRLDPKPKGFLEEYSPARFRIESAASDTAMISARSLSEGLFPFEDTSQRVPVFTQAERNDVTIDALYRCPTFLHDIDENTLLSNNMGWDEMERSYMDLLRRLATIPAFDAFVMDSAVSQESEFRYVPLEQIKHVYDIIREAKSTCQKDENENNNSDYSYSIELCQMLPFGKTATILTQTEWEDLKTLAKYTEVETKYGTNKAGQLLAGNWLQEMANRMVADETSDPYDTSSKRVFVTSADYPLMIAIMAALNVVQEDVLLEEAYPGYGSALMFELLQDTDTQEHSIQIFYKAVGQNQAIVLRTGGLCYEKQSCSMMSFTAQLVQLILPREQWCQTCANDVSDVCLWENRLTAQQQLKDEMDKEQFILNNVTILSSSPSSEEESIYDVANQDTEKVTPQQIVYSACPKHTTQNQRDSMRDDFIGFFFGGVLAGVVLTCLVLAVAYGIRKWRRLQRQSSDSDSPDKPRRITPKTPKTASPPMLASPLRRKTRWSPAIPKSPRSPMVNRSLDADSLMLDDEDEDHSVHLDDFEEEMYLPDPGAAPTQEDFPPEIV